MAEKKEKQYVSDNAQLMAEWDREMNTGLTPSGLTLGSHKKVWWKCKNDHKWQASIAHRNYGQGCPYCAGQKVLNGINDLQTINPNIAGEWNYEKNAGIYPTDVMPNSHKKVWWKCQKGHEWQTYISDRNRGRGCPICSSERNTSFPEYAILYYLKRYNVDARHSYKELGYELDIYIPSLKTAIEYDGYFWHKNKAEKDIEKNALCRFDGIILYRIREGLPSLNDSSIDYIVQRNQKDLSQTIELLLSKITRIKVDVDLARDNIDIENLREFTEKENSIFISNPDLAYEWNYEKNGTLKPEYFSANSEKKVWWKCKKGHEWQALISNRSKGNGCPYCSGQIVLIGINDLQTINPILASEWNISKNAELTPSDVVPNSHKKVWWKCKKGHEWQATIAGRNRGQGCPYCSGRLAITSENDLLTINPTLANEWNYERNGNLIPNKVTANSGRKVWWRCKKGHEWQATIASRNSGCGCPYCSGRLAVTGANDLLTVNPTLANEWNYEKNSGLTPDTVLPKSGKKVWWRCNYDHEWQATIDSRSRGNGCPECAKQKRKKKDT